MLPDLPADGFELRAGRVGDLVLGEDGVENSFFEVFICRQLLKINIQYRRLLRALALALRVVLRLTGGFEDCRDAQQLLRAEAAAAVRTVKRHADIVQPAEARRALDRDAGAGRGGLFQLAADLIRVVKRAQRHAALLGCLRGGLIGKRSQNLIKFQLGYGFFILFVHT